MFAIRLLAWVALSPHLHFPRFHPMADRRGRALPEGSCAHRERCHTGDRTPGSSGRRFSAARRRSSIQRIQPASVLDENRSLPGTKFLKRRRSPCFSSWKLVAGANRPSPGDKFGGRRDAASRRDLPPRDADRATPARQRSVVSGERRARSCSGLPWPGARCEACAAPSLAGAVAPRPYHRVPRDRPELAILDLQSTLRSAFLCLYPRSCH